MGSKFDTWLQQDEHRQLLSEAAIEQWKNKKPQGFKCALCEESFFSKATYAKYCSQRCKTSARAGKSEKNKRYYDRGEGTKKNHYERWTLEDERLVMQAATTDRQLSIMIGRTMRAIHARRTKLTKPQ